LESLEVHRSGFFSASQALTGAALSTSIHEQLGHKSHSAVRKIFLKDPEEADVRELRWKAVTGAVAKVLEDYHPVTGRTTTASQVAVTRADPRYRFFGFSTRLFFSTQRGCSVARRSSKSLS
jgi:hypothetical protein